MTLRIVTNEEGEVAPLPAHAIPTAHFLLIDEARLGYWRAVIKGHPKRIASALKAWKDLLSVPRTRVTNGS